MKNPYRSLRISFFLLTTLGLALPLCARAEPAAQAPPVFDSVAAALEPGGDFYMIVNPERFKRQVAAWFAKVELVVDTGMKSDQAPEEKRELVKTGFRIFNQMLAQTGLPGLRGVGVSSVPLSGSPHYRHRVFLHRAPEAGGLLWELFAPQGDSLVGLNLLPANTLLADCSRFRSGKLWDAFFASIAGSPLQGMLQEQLDVIKDKVDVEALVRSLDDEVIFAMTLHPERKLQFPLEDDLVLSIPEPGFLLALKVKNRAIMDWVDGTLTATELPLNQENVSGVSLRSLPIPLPFPMQLAPTLGESDGYILLASNPELFKSMLAVLKGEAPGLAGDAAFMEYMKDLPRSGNIFEYVGPQVNGCVSGLKNQLFKKMAQSGEEEGLEVLKILWSTEELDLQVAAVGELRAEGLLISLKSSDSGGELLLKGAAIAPAATMGVLASMAIPSFVGARDRAQDAVCQSNLRQLHGALQQYLLENGVDEMPDPEELTMYFMNEELPTCPQGGSYQLPDSPDGLPSCSLGGTHSLEP